MFLLTVFKNLEEQQRLLERDMKEKEVKTKDQRNDFERQLREKENILREMTTDMKKLLKQLSATKKKLKMREGMLRQGVTPHVTTQCQ